MDKMEWSCILKWLAITLYWDYWYHICVHSFFIVDSPRLIPRRSTLHLSPVEQQRERNPRSNKLFISNVIDSAMIWTTRSFTWTVDETKQHGFIFIFCVTYQPILKIEWSYVAKATSKYQIGDRTTLNECNFFSWIQSDE